MSKYSSEPSTDDRSQRPIHFHQLISYSLVIITGSPYTSIIELVTLLVIVDAGRRKRPHFRSYSHITLARNKPRQDEKYLQKCQNSSGSQQAPTRNSQNTRHDTISTVHTCSAVTSRERHQTSPPLRTRPLSSCPQNAQTQTHPTPKTMPPPLHPRHEIRPPPSPKQTRTHEPRPTRRRSNHVRTITMRRPGFKTPRGRQGQQGPRRRREADRRGAEGGGRPHRATGGWDI